MSKVKKSRFSEEQIIEIVREGDRGNLQVPAREPLTPTKKRLGGGTAAKGAYPVPQGG